MPRCHYRIEPRSPSEGGGWTLKKYEEDREVGRGAYLANPHEECPIGVAWFYRLPENVQNHWLKVGGSERLIDAWRAYLNAEAFIDAKREAEIWLATCLGPAPTLTFPEC